MDKIRICFEFGREDLDSYIGAINKKIGGSVTPEETVTPEEVSRYWGYLTASPVVFGPGDEADTGCALRQMHHLCSVIFGLGFNKRLREHVIGGVEELLKGNQQ